MKLPKLRCKQTDKANGLIEGVLYTPYAVASGHYLFSNGSGMTHHVSIDGDYMKEHLEIV